MPFALKKKARMSNLPLNTIESVLSNLTLQQRHDLKNALLSVRWAAELLRPPDGSHPPCELISEQLHAAYHLLQPVIDSLLSEGEHACE